MPPSQGWPCRHCWPIKTPPSISRGCSCIRVKRVLNQARELYTRSRCAAAAIYSVRVLENQRAEGQFSPSSVVSESLATGFASFSSSSAISYSASSSRSSAAAASLPDHLSSSWLNSSSSRPPDIIAIISSRESSAFVQTPRWRPRSRSCRCSILRDGGAISPNRYHPSSARFWSFHWSNPSSL